MDEKEIDPSGEIEGCQDQRTGRNLYDFVTSS